MTLKTFIVSIEASAVAELKKLGTAVKAEAVSETQVLVAQIKQSTVGEKILNLVSAASTTTTTGTTKFSTVLAAALPLLSDIPDLVVEVEDLGRELVQSIYNDFKSKL